MIKNEVAGVAVVGLGKMGISHLAIVNATQATRVVAVVDSSTLIGQQIEKHCHIPFIADYDAVLQRDDVDAVLIATPTRFHADMVRAALAAGKHVFCEKPMTLSAADSRELAEDAERRGLVAQVGYHNRYVGTFAEMKRLIETGTIGKLRHIHAEAYGPVVLRPVGKTWRSQAGLGGGCLYDYAAHPINLLNWYAGAPVRCSGADLTHQYSTEVDDAVYANLHFADGVTGQVSVNWSDETMRKMTTRMTAFGDGGKIIADRQEIQVFVGATGHPTRDYCAGWTMRNITQLTPVPDYYLRGEEYSAQIEAFGKAVKGDRTHFANDFASAAQTDLTLSMIRDAAAGRPQANGMAVPAATHKSWLSRWFGR